MAVTIEKLIDLLNMDLELEYSAAIQYINHAAVMTGAAYGDIIKELKIHTNEEIQHAMILADQIDYLGGSPSVKVGEIHTSKGNDEMLQQDLDGEEDAIQRYKLSPNYSIVVTGTGKGPHCVAETIGHEKYHKYIYDTYNGAPDHNDTDGVPDSVEGTLLGVSTLINDPDTYNMGGIYASYGDNEIRCRKKELNHGITVTTTNDWANPGTNSEPPY